MNVSTLQMKFQKKIINERGLILTDIEITTKQYQLK